MEQDEDFNLEAVEIKLGGKKFKMTVPLTVGQMQDLRIGVVEATPPNETTEEAVKRDNERQFRVFMIALSPENPDLTLEFLKTMREFPKRQGEAFRAILIKSGLLEEKDAKPGEAAADPAKE